MATDETRLVRHLVLDAIRAELANDAEERYRLVAEMIKHPGHSGADDLLACCGTLVAIARSISMDTAQHPSPGEVLATLQLQDAHDQRTMNLQTSLITAASVMHDDLQRGRLLALENSGWTQARVEAIRLAAQLLGGVDRPDVLLDGLEVAADQEP